MNKKSEQSLQFLKSNEKELRLIALEDISDDENLLPYLDALTEVATTDQDKYVRSLAVELLGRIDDSKSIEALFKSLEDEFWDVRETALDSLGKLKVKESIPKMIIALKDENRKVRETAAIELRKFEDSSILEPLFKALTDEDEGVVRAIETTLLEYQGPIDEEVISSLKHSKKDVIRHVLTKFVTFRTTDPLTILELSLFDDNWQIRLLAIKELEKLIQQEKQSKEKINSLCIKALKDENSQIRYQAVVNLGLIKDSSSIDPLIEIAKNDDTEKVKLHASTIIADIRRAIRLDE